MRFRPDGVIYPPMSDILSRAGVDVVVGYENVVSLMKLMLLLWAMSFLR